MLCGSNWYVTALGSQKYKFSIGWKGKGRALGILYVGWFGIDYTL